MKYIPIIAFFLNSTILIGQSPDSLIALIPSSNPGLQSVYRKVQAMEERQTQAWQWPEPQASLSAIAWPIPNRSMLPTATAGIMQPIPRKGARLLNQQLASTETNLVREEASLLQRNLRFQIRQAYWKLYELEQSIRILHKNLSLLEILERLAHANFESGKGTLPDILAIQLRQQALSQQIQRIDNERRSPLYEINLALGRTPTEPVFVQQEAALAQLPLLRDSIYSQASQTHPALVMLRLGQQASQQRQQINALESKPEIMAGLDYAVMQRAPDDDSGSGRDMWMPQLTVRVPLFQELYRSRNREEQYLQESIQMAQRERNNQISTDIEQAFTSLKSAEIDFALTQTQTPLVQSALEISREQFSANGTGLNTLLQYEEQLLMIQLDAIRAIVASHLAVAQLERQLN